MKRGPNEMRWQHVNETKRPGGRKRTHVGGKVMSEEGWRMRGSGKLSLDREKRQRIALRRRCEGKRRPGGKRMQRNGGRKKTS